MSKFPRGDFTIVGWAVDESPRDVREDPGDLPEGIRLLVIRHEPTGFRIYLTTAADVSDWPEWRIEECVDAVRQACIRNTASP